LADSITDLLALHSRSGTAANGGAAKPQAQAPATEAFAVLRLARRVWAVAAIHAEVQRLQEAHQELAARLLPGDRLVYLGNGIGHGAATIATLDELLAFRRDFLCLPGVEPEDIVYLRGAQEEMWRKLLQIQFAPGPREVFDWMLRHGLEPVLRGYGIDPAQAQAVLRDGAASISRWTNSLRAAIRQHPGHDELFASFRRAAYTEGGELLFVHAGIDPGAPLAAQSDHLWWGSPSFRGLAQPYAGFRRVISGCNPRGEGAHLDAFTCCLDGGAGFGGSLNVACFSPDGAIVENFAI
jgi:serine/threonine protein phosphatase 1